MIICKERQYQVNHAKNKSIVYIVAHLGLPCESKYPTISHFNVVSHNNGLSVFRVYVHSFVAALQ